MENADTKVLRAGSATKRAAILDAARELFMTDGFDRTSVDAIAARATVSKRTVYDYFGDKRALLLAVVVESSAALMASIRVALDATLTGDADLETALIDFSLRVMSSTLGTADYAAIVRLVSTEAPHLPAEEMMRLDNAPEEIVAERFAELGRRGLLEVPDSRTAADHYIALTFMMAYRERRADGQLDQVTVRRIIENGVRAFLRAYAPSQPPTPMGR
jgi:TetR/AcrR family transcriptional repressor of mexJK operon